MHRIHLILAALGFISSSSAIAQQPQPRAQSAAEVLRSIQQSSGDVEQLRAGLRSPDPSVRVSTFAAMINSNNPALYTVAINEGHVSSDAALRDLAARAAFRELSAFIVEPGADLPPESQATLVTFSETRGLHAKIEKYDWGTGQFVVTVGQGQISGSRLTFKTAWCQGSLAAVEGSWTYEGLVVCALNQTKLTGKMHVSIR
jgi:hypothetical protein